MVMTMPLLDTFFSSTLLSLWCHTSSWSEWTRGFSYPTQLQARAAGVACLLFNRPNGDAKVGEGDVAEVGGHVGLDWIKVDHVVACSKDARHTIPLCGHIHCIAGVQLDQCTLAISIACCSANWLLLRSAPSSSITAGSC